MITRAIEILLVEDNPGDARLTLEAFKEGKVINNVTVVRDGVEAMAYLRRQGPYGQARHPDIILLDLNLPRKDGREVLAEIKSDELLKFIPVVVLTTSTAEEDIARAYSSHANCYISKPVDLEQFLRVASSIESFWLNFVKLPHGALDV
jgi:two-component system, chemotaxis family, response regulator Rcp1